MHLCVFAGKKGGEGESADHQFFAHDRWGKTRDIVFAGQPVFNKQATDTDAS